MSLYVNFVVQILKTLFIFLIWIKSKLLFYFDLDRLTFAIFHLCPVRILFIQTDHYLFYRYFIIIAMCIRSIRLYNRVFTEKNYMMDYNDDDDFFFCESRTKG